MNESYLTLKEFQHEFPLSLRLKNLRCERGDLVPRLAVGYHYTPMVAGASSASRGRLHPFHRVP